MKMLNPRARFVAAISVIVVGTNLLAGCAAFSDIQWEDGQQASTEEMRQPGGGGEGNGGNGAGGSAGGSGGRS